MISDHIEDNYDSDEFDDDFDQSAKPQQQTKPIFPTAQPTTNYQQNTFSNEESSSHNAFDDEYEDFF